MAGDIEVWAAAGFFYFDNDASNFHEIAGPRARVEARLYDLPALGNDSRIVASYQYEYDDVRGTVNQGFLNVRIPFGHGGCRSCRPKMNLLDRRMVTPIVRDIDIVTNIAQDGRIEGAKNATLGTILDNVVTLTADDDIPSIIASGDPNQVFILDGSAGVEQIGGSITLDDGQILIGGGGAMNVVGCDTGLEAVFTAEGDAFTFEQLGGGNVINLTNNNGIYGITTIGGFNSIGGISPGDFEVSGNTLMGAGNNAIGLLPIGGSVANGNIMNNMFVGTGGDAIGALTVGGADVDLMIASNSFDMIGGNGVGITATLGSADINVVIDDNDFNDVAEDAISIGIPGIDLTASPTIDATITNNRIVGMGNTENGIDIFTGNDTDLTLLVDSNLIDGVNGDAIQLDSDTTQFIIFSNDTNATHDVTITNNTILGRGVTADGVDIDIADFATLMGTISGNTIDEVNSNAIEFSADDDTIVSLLTINENIVLGRETTSGGLDFDINDNVILTLVANNNIFDDVNGDAAYIDDDGSVDLTFNDNMIFGRNNTSRGIEVDVDDSSSLTGSIDGNIFDEVEEDGINLDIDDDSDASMFSISGNTFLGRGTTEDGVDLRVDDDASMTLIANNNIFDNIVGDAFDVDVQDDSFLDLTFNANQILGRGTTSDGVDISVTGGSVLNGTIQNNVLTDVFDSNIRIASNTNSVIDVDILDNTMTGGDFGLNVFANVGGPDNFLTVGGNTINVTSDFEGIFINANGNLFLDSNMQDNTVTNDGAGMIFNIDGDGDVQGNIMINGVDQLFP